MNFIAPEFLFALGVLIFPILIHLFNFRRFKTVYFSQVRFLKNIKQETQSTSRLKHLLVLISRCLAISALVFAFAQPFIQNDNNIIEKGKKGVIVYLDNSFSMESVGESGSLIQIGKIKVKAIADAYSSADRFKLITNNFEASEQRWLNKEDFLLKLQKMTISPIYRSIAQVQNRMNQSFNDDDLIIERYLLTDLQKSSIDLANLSDTNQYIVIPIQSSFTKNIGLRDLSFFNPYHLPNQLEGIQLKINNYGELEERKIPAQLFIDGKLKSPFAINFPMEDSMLFDLNYRNGETNQLNGKLIIKDYPITFDDTLYFSYPIRSQVNVLSIFENESNPNVEALFSGDSIIRFKKSPVKGINYSELYSYQLIILEEIKSMSSSLEQELIKFISNGGSLVLFPNQESDNSINRFLKSIGIGAYNPVEEKSITVSSLNEKSAIFKDVFDELPKNLQLPSIKSYAKIPLKSNQLVESIMQLQNGNSFLSSYQIDKGKVYLCAVGLNKEQSNLVNHAIFVPMLYNMALKAGYSKPTYYTLNESTIILPLLDKKESPVHIKGHGIDFIPAQRFIQNQLKIEPRNEINSAGHYELIRENKVLGIISFNYDRKESTIESYTPSEFLEEVNNRNLHYELINENTDVLSSKIQKMDQGTPLWKYFIILALIFIATEVLLLRFLK